MKSRPVMFNTIIASLAVVAAFCFFKVWKHLNYWKIRNVPFEPSAHPIFGHLHELGKTKALYTILKDIFDKHKKTHKFIGFFSFMTPSIMILDLDLAKEILIKDFSYFPCKFRFYNKNEDPLSANIMNLKGEEWIMKKQIMTKELTRHKLKLYCTRTSKECLKLVDFLKAKAETNANPVNIKDVILRFMTNLVTMFAFEVDANAYNDDLFMSKASFCQTPSRLVGVPLALVESFPRMCAKFGARLRPFEIDFYISVLDKVLKIVNFNHSPTVRKCLEMKLPFKETAAQVFTFFENGFSTVSHFIIFSLYELALNPEIQEKLRARIKDSLIKHKEVDYDCIMDIPYLDQVSLEILRIYSNASQISRLCEKDYENKKYNLKIEKGVLVVIPTDGVHFDPDNYPDPYTFNPDRFSRDEFKKRHPASFLTFGMGKRSCPGDDLTKVKQKTCLIHLLRNFRFYVAKDTVVPIKLALGMSRRTEGNVFLGIEILQDSF